MKSKYKFVSILLSAINAILLSVLIVIFIHDVAVSPEQAIIKILADKPILQYIAVAIISMGLAMSIISIVFVALWSNRKAIFGSGIASIFSLNLIAGFVMVLSADPLTFEKNRH